MGTVGIANQEMAAAWDGPEGSHWTKHAARYERASYRHWQRLVGRVDIGSDHSVLDVGCGTGSSTRQLARLADRGTALGVDLSAEMLAHAREVAAAEGLTNIRFEQGDAQVYPFEPASHDVAVSAFGAMFFADPVAAFTNIGRGLRPGGRLALLVWRELSRNEWLLELRQALAAGRRLPEPPVGVPGPFGLAESGHAQQVLGRGGFVDVALEEVDEPMAWGSDADDAFAFMSDLGVVRGLTSELDDAAKERALAALRAAIAERETSEGVLFGSSSWLITATRGPGF